MAAKKKVVAVAVTTVALTAGSFGIAEAASKVKTISTKTKIASTSISNPAANGVAGRGQELANVLAGLVTKGTITQAQADAITAALDAARAAHQDNDGDRPMGKGPKGAAFVDKLTVASTTLGIDTATIQSRLKAGESLATIAGAKKDALIAALVAAETKAIDAAVTAGSLTSAQATSLKADLTAHVTAEVNGTLPGGMMGGPKGGKGGRGGHGPMGGPNGSTSGTTGGIPSTGTGA